MGENSLREYQKKKVLEEIRRSLMKRDLALKYERDTKRTYRFTEDGDRPAIGTLYVQKHVFDGKAPKEIRVSIEWD